MSWTHEQMVRLTREKRILKEFFPTFAWVNPADPKHACIEGDVESNAGKTYRLQVPIPEQFPSTSPDLFVLRPMPLKDRSGNPMTSVSASMHTWRGVGGATRICHGQPGMWVPENTLYLVLLKGRIWIEAYEAHLRTGEPLDHFLRHMDDREMPAPEPPERHVSAESGAPAESGLARFFRNLFS